MLQLLPEHLSFHLSPGQLLLSLWASSLYMCPLGLSSGATFSRKPSKTSLPLKSALYIYLLWALIFLYHSTLLLCKSIRVCVIMDCKYFGTCLFLPVEQGLAKYSPQAKSGCSLLLKIKFYWSTTTFTQLHVICGYSHTTMIELSSCDGAQGSLQKRLLTSAPDHLPHEDKDSVCLVHCCAQHNGWWWEGS